MCIVGEGGASERQRMSWTLEAVVEMQPPVTQLRSVNFDGNKISDDVISAFKRKLA